MENEGLSRTGIYIERQQKKLKKCKGTKWRKEIDGNVCDLYFN
jgi:hypothetical protein